MATTKSEIRVRVVPGVILRHGGLVGAALVFLALKIGAPVRWFVRFEV